jgi:phosphate transport system substrate-binding protein
MKTNKKLKLKILFLPILSLLLLTACDQGGVNKIDETPTRGDIKISVDESYQPLLETEISTFESLYTYAKIRAVYLPENDLFTDFFNDSVRGIITSRKLTKQEEDGLLSHQIIARTTKIAYDALAFITNNENADSLLRYDQIRDIFGGKITRWDQINKKSKVGNIEVVFDNVKSANVRFIREKFNMGTEFPDYCKAVNSNEDVINYVEKTKGAIGIISVNWISDKDDTLSLNFLKRIQVVAVGSELDTTGDSNFLRPYQGYIAEGSYPFTREVYYIGRESFSGLGTGFVQWVAADQGQRIILKSGLVPATMPIRLIQIKK